MMIAGLFFVWPLMMSGNAMDPAAVPAVQDRAADPLEALSPSQRRAVRRLLEQGEVLRVAPAPSDDILRVPEFDPLMAGEVARLDLVEVNPSGHRYVTFAQVFAMGDVFADSQLMARMGRQDIPVQLDPKASHPDGSVRHAVVTFMVPDVRRLRPVTLRVASGEEGLAQSPVMPFHFYDVEIAGPDARVDSGSFSLHQTEEQSRWLDGALVRESVFRIERGPLLTVRAEVRNYADGTHRLRLTVENVKTFADLPRDLSYRIRVLDDDVLFDETIAGHYRNSAWTTVIESTPPAFVVRQDPALMIEVGAIPPFDLTQPVRGDSLDHTFVGGRPGQYGPVNPNMPQTGGRPDLGLLTRWSASWAMTQDPGARSVMLRVADVGLTIPWHFEDDDTGAPVRLDQRPRFWADARGHRDAYGARDGHPASLYLGEAGGWTTDIAHKPSLAYAAYLATGEAVYARALAHEAAYGLNAVWPDLRAGRPLVTRALQLRSAAWSLRSVSNAAWLLPDSDPMKEYFARVRYENIADLYTRFVTGGALSETGVLEGYFPTPGDADHTLISPWQQDFMAMTLAQEVRRGDPMAEAVLNWMTPYIAGRVLASDGNIRLAAARRHRVVDPMGQRYSNWDDVFAASAGVIGDFSIAGADDMYGVLRTSVAAIVRATGHPLAEEALEALRAEPGAESLLDPSIQGSRAYNTQYAID